jgi:hypothetical protein
VDFEHYLKISIDMFAGTRAYKATGNFKPQVEDENESK